MVRVLFEISLPSPSLDTVAEALREGALGPGITARLGLDAVGTGCSGPARGGNAGWTPCWIAIEGQEENPGPVAAALSRVKALVVEACRSAGLELFAIPANAQIRDEFYRLRDILDVPGRLERR